MRLDAVHQPAASNRADAAAERKQRGDERRVAHGESRVANQRGQPARHQIVDEQPHEIGEPQHRGARTIARRQHDGRARAPLLAAIVGQHEAHAVERRIGRDPAQHRGDALVRRAAQHHEADRFGQRDQQRAERKRRDTADDEHAAPPVLGNQRGGDEAARGRAQRKAAEHRVDEKRAFRVRRILGHQRRRVRHRRAQPEPRQQPQHRELGDRLRESAADAEESEQHDRAHQHALAADPVGKRARRERAEREADERRAHHRPQRGLRHVPLLGERGRDETDRGGVEAVRRDDQKTQDQNQPLIGRKAPFVDELLHIELAREIGHCCLRWGCRRRIRVLRRCDAGACRRARAAAVRRAARAVCRFRVVFVSRACFLRASCAPRGVSSPSLLRRRCAARDETPNSPRARHSRSLSAAALP
ncbi:Uncharacterised protein [Burkholderia pseudomallei]|nr:Uncharacterised protein [Burkholderia pseudomallei]